MTKYLAAAVVVVFVLASMVVPNLVERRWYHRFLHNARGELLTAMLLLNGNRRINIVSVPWYLRA